jgi:hypothetical protein
MTEAVLATRAMAELRDGRDPGGRRYEELLSHPYPKRPATPRDSMFPCG